MTMLMMMIIMTMMVNVITNDDNDEDEHLASSVKSLTESLLEEREYFLPGGGQHRIL